MHRPGAMSRVAAIVLVAALLGVGWWATTSDPFGRSAPVAVSTDGAETVPAAATDDGAASDVSTVSTTEAADDAATAAASFEPLPFVSDEPVQRFEAPEQVLEPTLDYRAEIETNVGTMLVDLYEDRAPTTVNNFVFLARHRYYEGVPFHRVIEEFMAQTGDPTGTGRGGPGYTFDDEIADALVHDRAGLLSMANAGPDTNGSQFFVTMAATPWLDGRHAIFGEVLEGLDTLDALTRVDPQNPSIVAALSDPAERLAEQGVDEARGQDGDVEAFLLDELGELPNQGQTFRVAGRRGVFGTAAGVPAIGLFPVPDRIERVTVYARPKEDGS